VSGNISARTSATEANARMNTSSDWGGCASDSIRRADDVLGVGDTRRVLIICEPFAPEHLAAVTKAPQACGGNVAPPRQDMLVAQAGRKSARPSERSTPEHRECRLNRAEDVCPPRPVVVQALVLMIDYSRLTKRSRLVPRLVRTRGTNRISGAPPTPG
jgi:hypothetical protein